MKYITILFLFICSTATAQKVKNGWVEDGKVQTWDNITIYLKDSVTDASKGFVIGMVKTWRKWFYINDKIDSARGPDWTNIKVIMYSNGKIIPWSIYDHYKAPQPGSNKIHMR